MERIEVFTVKLIIEVPLSRQKVNIEEKQKNEVPG